MVRQRAFGEQNAQKLTAVMRNDQGNEGRTTTDLKSDALRDRYCDAPSHQRVKAAQDEDGRRRAGKVHRRRVEEKQGGGKLRDGMRSFKNASPRQRPGEKERKNERRTTYVVPAHTTEANATASRECAENENDGSGAGAGAGAGAGGAGVSCWPTTPPSAETAAAASSSY